MAEGVAAPPTPPPAEAVDVQALFREYVEEAQTKLDDAVEAVEKAAEISPRGSFADRVSSRLVDLVTLMDEDPQPPATIPGSNGVLLEGVAHLWPMERKGGKSIATLVTALDVVLAGGSVAILDRENGKNRYALRLRDIADARSLTADQREALRQRLRYFEFPRVRKGDEGELVELLKDADLVVYDSSRTFMTSQDLKEDSSDDYAQFMAATIEPLTAIGIATLILDNSGWSDSGRPRGTSSKEDLNEHLFKSAKVEEFDREATGLIVLEVKESRDGLTGTWTMRIGGGVYDSWQQADEGISVGRSGKGNKQKTEKAQRLDSMRQLLGEEPDLSNDDLAARLEISARTIRNYRAELALEPVPIHTA